MKPLTGMVLALLLAPSAGASPSSEEFVIKDIEQTKGISRVSPLPLASPEPVSRQHRLPSKLSRVVQGTASWYGPGFYGRTTANGERFRQGTMTAAHRTLPFGTRVLVTNLNNGRSVVVRINDRGPFRDHRMIDLAHGAAQELRMVQAGEIPVRLEVLTKIPKTK